MAVCFMAGTLLEGPGQFHPRLQLLYSLDGSRRMHRITIEGVELICSARLAPIQP